MKKICLLDLNYTLVANQAQTHGIRPFSARLAAEEYRGDLIDAVRSDLVILVTARPRGQEKQTLDNIQRKTGWLPDEWYFNDVHAAPPVFKESALIRFVLPKYGDRLSDFYAVESNPTTRIMYATHQISAEPYDVFIREGICDTYDSRIKRVTDLLSKLDLIYGYGTRFPGENPECEPLEYAIEAELRRMSKPDLDHFLSGLDMRHLTDLYGVLMDLSDDGSEMILGYLKMI